MRNLPVYPFASGVNVDLAKNAFDIFGFEDVPMGGGGTSTEEDKFILKVY